MDVSDSWPTIEHDGTRRQKPKVPVVEPGKAVFRHGNNRNNSWQFPVKGVEPHRYTGSFKTNVENKTKQQSAASAAVQYETGNFIDKAALGARLGWGVPKAFL
jgi:hypothetical protein